MAIAEKEIRRGPVRQKPTTKLAGLEGKLHEGRVAIKSLTAQLEMFQTLAANELMTQADFAKQRTVIVTEVRILGYRQHATRQELRPLKRVTEKRKSPFTNSLPESGVVFVKKKRPQKKSNRILPQDQNPHIQAELSRLWKKRKRKEISRKDYTRTHQRLVAKLPK